MNPCASATPTPASPSESGRFRPADAGHLARLFRASLRDGRLHPLYVPMQQYRSGPNAVPA